MPHSTKEATEGTAIFHALFTLEKILELQAGSLKIKKLSLPKKPSFRPTIHIYLYAPIGAGKSTLAQKIAEEYKTEVYSNETLAGLTGGYRRQKQISLGHAWTSRNKPLILDEFDFKQRSEIQRAILQILDPGTYTRSIFYTHRKGYFRYDGGLYFKINRGKGLRLKTRVAGLFLTMKDFSRTDSEFHGALLDRCIPIRFFPTIQEINLLWDRALFFNRNKYNPPEEVVIEREDELYIRNLVNNLLAGQPEYYPRIIGDCLRAFAVTGEHDEALYRLIWLLKLGNFK